MVSTLGLSPHGLLGAWDWPVGGKGPGIFPCSCHSPFHLSVHKLPWIYTFVLAMPPAVWVLFPTVYTLGMPLSSFPFALECTILCELSPSSCILWTWARICSPCFSSSSFSLLRKSEQREGMQANWGRMKRHIVEQGKQVSFIFVRGMRTQELHAYLCRFCCSCRHLCCSCWWCWAAASRSSSAFLFSSLNSCLEVGGKIQCWVFPLPAPPRILQCCSCLMASEEEPLGEGGRPLRPTQGIQPMFHILQLYLHQFLCREKE